MRRIKYLLFFISLVMLFGIPFSAYAEDYIYFTTTIHNWNHVDPLTYPCGSFNSTIEMTSDTNHYTYGSCYNNTVNLNNYIFDDDSDIVIKETIRVTNNMKKYGFYLLGLFGDSNDYSNTPFEAYLQKAYDNPGYFKVVEVQQIDPNAASYEGNTEENYEVIAESDKAEENYEDLAESDKAEEDNYVILGVDGDTTFTEIEVGSTTNLGTVSYPDSYYLKYQFVVRGNLADPSGTFLYRFDELDNFSVASQGTSITFRNNLETTSPYYMNLNLGELERFLEEKIEANYTDVDNAGDYSVLFHTLGGEGYASIIADPLDDDSYGITFEVEARNDSTVVNTGLLYDLWPFALLAGTFLLFFVFFRKTHIKEEEEEEII